MLRKESIIAVIGGIFVTVPSSAQPVLEQATLHNLINRVLINENEAEEEDKLFPEELLQTQSNSRADLVFNEGTIARATSNTRFRFESGLRRFQLTDGTELLIIRPGNGGTIETPNAEINVPGTALFIQHQPEDNQTRVGVLTNHPNEGVQVSNAQGEDTVELDGGEIVTVTDDVVGDVQTFNLRVFYETSELTAGLGPGCQNQSPEGPSAVQTTLEAVCPETLAALREQANIPSNIPANEEPNENIRGIAPSLVGPNEEGLERFPIRIEGSPEQEIFEPVEPVEPVQPQ